MTKEKIKITSSDHFNELLNLFKEELYKKIPYHENCLIQFHQVQDAGILMQYGGNCLICELQTESSGKDNYLIYLDRDNTVNFIYIKES